MDVISYSVFRTNLASTLDQVNDNHKPVLITRKNGRPPGQSGLKVVEIII